MPFGWIEFIATGFYSGKLRPAPGTWGTLAGLPVAWALSLTGQIPYMVGVLGLVILGVYVSEVYQTQKQAHDLPEIVIDEFAGIAISMTWIPWTWQSIVTAFVVFRFFDILKPPPIRQLDRKVEGGLGVMADDIAAGVVTNFVLQLLLSQTDWLGTQLLL